MTGISYLMAAVAVSCIFIAVCVLAIAWKDTQ